MYLTGEGPLKRSIGEGVPDKAHQRRSNGEGRSIEHSFYVTQHFLQAGVYRSYAPSLLHMYLIGEGPTEKVSWKRPVEEDDHRKRGLTPEPTMALIPCERIEKKNIFLLNE